MEIVIKKYRLTVRKTRHLGLKNSALPLVVALFLYLTSIIVVQAMPLQHGLSLTPKIESEIKIEAYYVSEKLDGIRGYWDGTTLYSRQGYTIVAPDWFTKNLGEKPLDGEIWLGRQTFQTLSGLIARNDVDDPLWNEVTYQIFDLPAEKGRFKERVEIMKRHIQDLSVKNPHVKMVSQMKIASLEALNLRLTKVIANGGEGLMLHHENALYQPYIRHDSLLKVKEIDDGCAVIRGFTKGKGKYKNMVGALIVETVIDQEIKRFRIGSGLTDKMREHPPEVGSIITYLHNGFTKRGIPRFPRLDRIHVSDCSPEKIPLLNQNDAKTHNDPAI